MKTVPAIPADTRRHSLTCGNSGPAIPAEIPADTRRSPQHCGYLRVSITAAAGIRNHSETLPDQQVCGDAGICGYCRANPLNSQTNDPSPAHTAKQSAGGQPQGRNHGQR